MGAHKVLLFLYVVFGLIHAMAVLYAISTPWWGGGELSNGYAMTNSPWWRCVREKNNNDVTAGGSSNSARPNIFTNITAADTFAWTCLQIDADTFVDYSDPFSGTANCQLSSLDQKNRFYLLRGFILATGGLSAFGSFLGILFVFVYFGSSTSYIQPRRSATTGRMHGDNRIGACAAFLLCVVAIAATVFAALGTAITIMTFKDYLFCNQDVCGYLIKYYEMERYGGPTTASPLQNNNLGSDVSCKVTFYNSAYVYYVATAFAVFNIFIGFGLICSSCGCCCAGGRSGRRGHHYKKGGGKGVEDGITPTTTNDDDNDSRDYRHNNNQRRDVADYNGSGSNRYPSASARVAPTSPSEYNRSYSRRNGDSGGGQQRGSPCVDDEPNYRSGSNTNNYRRAGNNDYASPPPNAANGGIYTYEPSPVMMMPMPGATTGAEENPNRGRNPIPPSMRHGGGVGGSATTQAHRPLGGSNSGLNSTGTDRPRPVVPARSTSARPRRASIPPPDGYVPPANGDWVWDINNGLYWSQNEYLFLNPTDGHFYDPDSQHWFNPDTEMWYPSNGNGNGAVVVGTQ